MKKKNPIQTCITIVVIVVAIALLIYIQLFLNEKIQVNILKSEYQINCNKLENKCYIYKKTFTDKEFNYIGNFVLSNIDVIECSKNKRIFNMNNLSEANSYYKITIGDPINKFEVGQYKDLETCNTQRRKILFKVNNLQVNEATKIYISK